jgi:hypothetical protein
VNILSKLGFNVKSLFVGDGREEERIQRKCGREIRRIKVELRKSPKEAVGRASDSPLP